MAGTMVKETIDFWKLEEFWNGYPIPTFYTLAVPHVNQTYTWIKIGFRFTIHLKDTSQMSLPLLGVFGTPSPSSKQATVWTYLAKSFEM